MILAFVGLLLQQAIAAPDTLSAFDSPATQALVERAIREGAQIPLELRDYRAEARTQLHLSFKADSGVVGELPISVDEFAGEVRWERSGRMRHWLRGHRLRLAAPAPYTVGTAVEDSWLIPHLYGSTIEVLRTSLGAASTRNRSARAIHPFSERGLLHYRYTAGDTIRIRTGSGTVTLVPITVEPLHPTDDARALLVAGSFGIDVERAAVARARFGFVEPSRGLRLVETGAFFELENALVQNRFWLPYRQRRELQATSLLAGGGAVARFVTSFSNYELNTGWIPRDDVRSALIREIIPGDSAFRGWNAPVGTGAAEYDVTDFADLRRAIAEGTLGEGPPVHVVMRPERADHLFRYNRVEGPFAGLAAAIEPRVPSERWWSVYATGGWAFAEGTPRGEVLARLRPWGIGNDGIGISAGAYRRLRDTQVFRPSIEADIMYSLPAALGGTDLRDFYAVQGAELQGTYRQGLLSLRAGGRWEQQDSVQRNTTRYLFGEAADFPLVAPAVPGRHAALEGEVRFGRGGGALGITNSWVSSFRGEVGVGDFRFSRAVGVVSARRSLGPLAVGARVDAGHVWGSAPSQYIFRFGGAEGLRGYDPNAFSGSSAVLGRGRAVAFLPFGNEPAANWGPLIIPPLRPALVVSGDLGWTTISDATRDELLRLGSRTTDGVRPVVGLGLSFFEDALTAEWVRPLRPLDGQDQGWRFRFGLAGWY